MTESTDISASYPQVKQYQIEAIQAAELALTEKGELHHVNWLETIRYELTHDVLGRLVPFGNCRLVDPAHEYPHTETSDCYRWKSRP